MTPFAKRVIKIVVRIPRGQTLTYKEVACAASSPRAYRAVGNILNRNYDPFVPCHRVIRSDGKLGGYNRGSLKKQTLLEREKTIPVLSDSTILIKKFELVDARNHLAGEDAEQIRWISGGKSTINTVRSWIRRNEKSWEQDGPLYNFAVWLKKKNGLIGMVEASVDKKKIKGLRDREANISYALYPQWRGKGYATRAVKLMLRFLKKKGLKFAIIRVNPNNIKSLKIPINCGFKKIDTIKVAKENLIIFRKRID